ncbi:MAG TPA: hypothetical protein VJT67_05365 [Longimicrobiaceae bacterium]|nr:hypothetical protein [Longimicrobiaceae bacterium]
MKPIHSRALALTLASLALAGCDGDATTPPTPLEQLKTATTVFQNVQAATAAGFVAVSPCVAVPGAGAMGFHYMAQSRVDATVNPAEPEILLYAPVDGGLQLLGAEFMVPADAWDASHTSPPTFDGQVFDDHRAEAARHGMPFGHYELHVWAWQPNPSGLYAPFNPTVQCPAAAAAMAAHSMHAHG